MSRTHISRIIKELSGGEWVEEANCRNMDLDLFFPKVGENVSPFTREVCSECPVMWECLWYANETSTEQGIFGGMSPSERKQWRVKNQIALGQSYDDWSTYGYRPGSSVRY